MMIGIPHFIMHMFYSVAFVCLHRATGLPGGADHGRPGEENQHCASASGYSQDLGVAANVQFEREEELTNLQVIVTFAKLRDSPIR